MAQQQPPSHNEQYLEKPLPSSPETERYILGGILLDVTLMDEITDIISPDDFYSPPHKNVFKAMVEIHQEHDLITVASVYNKIKSFGTDYPQGMPGVVFLTSGLPHFGSREMRSYAKLIKDKSLARQLIKHYTHFISEALAEEKPITDLIEEAETGLYAISDTRRDEEAFTTMTVAVDETIAKIELAGQTSQHITGLSTGLLDLDEKTSGLQKTDLIIVAARPSMGKTGLGLVLAQNAALYHDAVVVIFSLEMSREQLVKRMLSTESGLDSHLIRGGFLSNNQWQELRAAGGRLKGGRIFINDMAGISPNYMRAKMRRLSREINKPIDLTVVDYLQLMSSSKRTENRQQEVSNISRELKGLAKEFNVPMVALSQLSRAPEARNPPRPMMSDLRESGAIEQDADVVAFIYREEYYKPTLENAGMGEIIVAKQRNGPTGPVPVTWVANTATFKNAANSF
jgi:replicative DNA helicase